MTERPTCRLQGSSCKRQCTRRKCRRGGNHWGRKSACRQHPGFYGKKNTATYHPIRHVSRNPPWILGWYVRTHPGSKPRTVFHSNELKTSLPLFARLGEDVKRGFRMGVSDRLIQSQISKRPLADAWAVMPRKLRSKPNFVYLYADTTASRIVEQLKKSSSPSPLRYQGTERSVSNREGDTRYLCFTTSLPGIDSCCTVTPSPESPVGSNTETDDDCRRRQFSIGKLSVRKLPSQSNNSRRERRT